MSMLETNTSFTVENFTTSHYTNILADGPRWIDTAATVTFVGPTGSFRFLEDDSGVALGAGEVYLYSFCVKYVDAPTYLFRLFDNGVSSYYRRWIDLSTMTLGSFLISASTVTVLSETLLSEGDGWYRYSLKIRNTNAATVRKFHYLVDSDSSSSSGAGLVGLSALISNPTSGTIRDGSVLLPDSVRSFMTTYGYTFGSNNDAVVNWLRTILGRTTGSYNDLLDYYKKIDLSWDEF